MNNKELQKNVLLTYSWRHRMINIIILNESNKDTQNINYNSKFKHKQCQLHKMRASEMFKF